MESVLVKMSQIRSIKEAESWIEENGVTGNPVKLVGIFVKTDEEIEVETEGLDMEEVRITEAIGNVFITKPVEAYWVDPEDAKDADAEAGWYVEANEPGQ